MTVNILALGEEGRLKAQILNKPQILKEVQMFNLALLPLFRQTLVGGSFLLIIGFFPFINWSVNVKRIILFSNSNVKTRVYYNI